jgi:hypothetical protein
MSAKNENIKSHASVPLRVDYHSEFEVIVEMLNGFNVPLKMLKEFHLEDFLFHISTVSYMYLL